MVTQKGTTLGYLPQDGLSLKGRTVFAECMTVFAGLRALEEEQEQPAHRMSYRPPLAAAQVADRFHMAESEFRARDGYTVESQVGAVLSGLGFSQRDWKRHTEEFSGGWQMRIVTSQAAARKPNLLLLDELTNHLDPRGAQLAGGLPHESYPQRLRAGLARPLFSSTPPCAKSSSYGTSELHFYSRRLLQVTEVQKTERRAQLSRPPSQTSERSHPAA